MYWVEPVPYLELFGRNQSKKTPCSLSTLIFFFTSSGGKLTYQVQGERGDPVSRHFGTFLFPVLCSMIRSGSGETTLHSILAISILYIWCAQDYAAPVLISVRQIQGCCVISVIFRPAGLLSQSQEIHTFAERDRGGKLQPQCRTRRKMRGLRRTRKISP